MTLMAMRLLVDSDVFCTLGAAGLLKDVASMLGVDWSKCCRLPALPHMLRRGRLHKWLGRELCERLLPVAEQMNRVPEAPADWLGQIADVPDIDPGEAQLFACAAANDDLILTGDKRSLHALKSNSVFVAALQGRIALPHAALLALCELRGDNCIREAMTPVLRLDTMLRTCFSEGNSAPRDGLHSYLTADTVGLHPLILWLPRQGPSS